MPKLPISLQLYTVRDLTAKDFAGTIREVAKIGYRYVELAGFGNLKTAPEARKVLNENGIKASGAHATIEALEADVNKVMDEAATMGHNNIIVPWMPEPRRKDAAGWKQTAADLSKVAKACKAKGYNFAYHNHSFEFQKFDGQYGLDILWQNADPLVKSELDTYWVQHGGADPVAYMNKLADRVLILHLKDMERGDERRFASVGTGILDFASILAAAEKHGVLFGVVEQDNCYDTPSLEAAKISFENLKQIGI